MGEEKEGGLGCFGEAVVFILLGLLLGAASSMLIGREAHIKDLQRRVGQLEVEVQQLKQR